MTTQGLISLSSQSCSFCPYSLLESLHLQCCRFDSSGVYALGAIRLYCLLIGFMKVDLVNVTAAARGHSYTILTNRTAVDRELIAMRKDNVLRIFRLNTGREDWGLMSTEHYLRLVSSVARCIRGSSYIQLTPPLYTGTHAWIRICCHRTLCKASISLWTQPRIPSSGPRQDCIRFFRSDSLPPPMLLFVTVEPDTQCFRENTSRGWGERSPGFSS